MSNYLFKTRAAGGPRISQRPKFYGHICRVILCLCVAGWTGSGIAQAEIKGQIINVNQNYQIAFTDLGNNALKQGEVVKVFLDTTDFLYMEVVESSSILSKLGPSRHDVLKTNLKDFFRISVGNPVVKVSPAEEQLTAEPKPDAVSADHSSPAELESLRSQLSLATDEILKLRAANDLLQKKVTDLSAKAEQTPAPADVPKDKNRQEILSRLKLQLEKMDKAVSK